MPEISPQLLGTMLLVQTLLIALFCYTLYKAILEVKESNRTIKPGLIWLLLIPGFMIIWNFKVIPSLTSSLHKEFSERDFDIEDKPGFAIGMTYAVLSILSPLIMILGISQLLILGEAVNLAGIVFFIQYWVKINWYRKVLENDSQNSNSSPEE